MCTRSKVSGIPTLLVSSTVWKHTHTQTGGVKQVGEGIWLNTRIKKEIIVYKAFFFDVVVGQTDCMPVLIPPVLFVVQK